MASSEMHVVYRVFVFAALLDYSCNGFYIPGSYRHTYSTGDAIFAKVNSLTSIEIELPYSYYSLPYCKPFGGIKKSAENLGELLMGDQIDNSLYRFRMNVNETVYLCTTNPLNENEVKLLKQRNCDLYQVNMILDNLPAIRFVKQNDIKIQWTGIPVGYSPTNSNEDYIINHLKFKVLVHEYEGRDVEIIGTKEEGLGVISEADKSIPNEGCKIHLHVTRHIHFTSSKSTLNHPKSTSGWVSQRKVDSEACRAALGMSFG